MQWKQACLDTPRKKKPKSLAFVYNVRVMAVAVFECGRFTVSRDGNPGLSARCSLSREATFVCDDYHALGYIGAAASVVDQVRRAAPYRRCVPGNLC